jgi:predicted deacylase
MLRDRPAPEVPGPFWRTTEVSAPSGGYAVVERQVGERVASGATVARVLSPLGEVLGEARAPDDATIWVTRHRRSIDAGELICALARPVEVPA